MPTPSWWQGSAIAPPRLGFSFVTPSGVAQQEQLAAEGKLWYVHPNSGVSQFSSAGSEGPFTIDEARRRQSAMRASQSSATQIQLNPLAAMPTVTPTTATTPPGTTATPPGTTTKTPAPQFIQPYARQRGPGAYGETDINW